MAQSMARSMARSTAQSMAQSMAQPMATIPRATYRVQLHSDFRFDDARALVPYLAALGISHLYCSPFLRARPGSRHGYDIVEHDAINPEIGDRASFEALVATLRAHDMGLLMDVVPNHMGVLGGDNRWWIDVLEHGRASSYATYFDIDWDAPEEAHRGRVLLPILGAQYGIVLERGELRLAHEANAGFVLHYYEHRLPIDPATYPRILSRVAEDPSLAAPLRAALRRLCVALQALPARDAVDPALQATRRRDASALKAELASLMHIHPALAQAVTTGMATLNGDPGQRDSFDALDALVAAQAYRLAYWRVAADEINYRRFFDINDLAALRVEDPAVFEATHRLVLDLLAQRLVDGLRIDHPDGLYDPAAYFARLQERYAQVTGVAAAATDRPLYVLAEKIVAPHEQLPGAWAVYGTTGYRFANVITGLFVDGAARARLDRAWRAFAGDEAEDFDVLVYRCKRLVLETTLAGELTVLARALARLARADRHTRDFTGNALRRALGEVIACFPVYRTYVVDQPSAQDRRWFDWAVARARRFSRAAEPSVLDFIHDVLRGTTPPGAPPALREDYRAFVRRLQQFTGPVAAKGIEDTAFYRHPRLLALNEVGGDPDSFGVTVKAFHGASRDRAQRWGHTMLATTTHDTKRSEDVRARLTVITELPAAWRLAVRRWSRMNRSHRRQVDGQPAPWRNDEYLLYQTLLGTLPRAPLDDAALAAYRERIEAYALKAAREAKVHTSWIAHNTDYEEALLGFVRGMLGGAAGRLFLDDLGGAVATFGWFGALNTLAMTALKFASPGVPDVYQGQEGFDLSLVDPDNRRPVDFAQRGATLVALQALAALPDLAGAVAALCAQPDDGRAKTWITWRALELRRRRPALFADGDYVPLAAEGAQAAHVVAFARRHGDEVLLAVTGRLFAGLGCPPGVLPVGDAWQDTALALQGSGLRHGRYRDVLTGRVVVVTDERLALAAVLAVLPFALLHGPVDGEAGGAADSAHDGGRL
jgi:(1->4)-alpha-D-glucan 1-alpha-D-glucosylmutase